MPKTKTAQPPAQEQAAPTKTPRADTKTAAVIAALQRPEGATLAQMQTLTGWQAHSVRGILAGALKKTFNFAIASEKTEQGRVYRIVTEVRA